MNLPFFTVSENLLDIYFDQYPKFFEWTSITFGELVDLLPNVGLSVVTLLADFINKVFNTNIEVPYFNIAESLLDLFDHISTEFFNNEYLFSELTVFAFVLGFGAAIMSALAIGRWFYKLFD